MVAKTWESDFRFDAITASIRKLNDEDRQDPYSCTHSFCLPVAERPVVGWTPGRIMLIFLVLGFVLLLTALYLMAGAEDDDVGLLVLGFITGLSGMACFFAPVVLDRWLMRLILGQRGASLLQHHGTVLCTEVSDGSSLTHSISIDGDDYVLVVADEQKRRLLIEGVVARYQVLATDVTCVEPFQFMNHVGASVTVQIDEGIELQLALARVSMLFEVTQQLPFLFFLRKRISNPILDVCVRALTDNFAQPSSL